MDADMAGAATPSETYSSSPRILPDMFGDWINKPVRIIGKVRGRGIRLRLVNSNIAVYCR